MSELRSRSPSRRLGAGLVALGLATAAWSAMWSFAASAAPPGNNGTIKIANVTIDGVDDSDSSNHPHVNADFAIQWYGFDAGTRTTTVAFEAQPPSGTTAVPRLVGRGSFTFEASGDPADLNHTELYRLDTTGLTEHEVQGFHIKVVATIDGAQGNDTKSKVFWVREAEPTESPSPSVEPTTEPPSESPTVEPSVLPTRLTQSVSPSVKGVKIVKPPTTLPHTGPASVLPLALVGFALIGIGTVMLRTPKGAHQR